jgi:hypothetical protein
MFDHKHYVPILKGRDGEYGALGTLADKFRQRMTPLVEVPPIPWDFEEECPLKTIDAHLAKVTQKIARAWGPKELLVDLLWIAEAERMDDGQHPVEFVFDSGRAQDLALIPVVGLVRTEEYLAACARQVQNDGRGACIRIQREDFADFADLGRELARVLAAIDLGPAETDLLLDLRALTPDSRRIDANSVIQLIAATPHIRSWRTFTVAATSFPENLTGLPPSDCSFIPRLEWNLWKEILQGQPARIPSFGDYGISHPEPSEVDPRVMRPSASIRYTANGSWLVLKGRNLRDHGYEQFYDVCDDLIGRDEYNGRDFSWGDGYIDDCANRIVGTGNLTTWRKVGTSHHLTFVLRDLAKTFGS